MQTLTWQSLLLQITLSSIPALFALAATYVTLRHQRKSKSDELASTASLKGRELMFGVYEKRLDELVKSADALSEALGGMQAALSLDPGVEKAHAFASRFFSVLYAQRLRLPQFVAESEAELAELGLSAEFEEIMNYIKTHEYVPTAKDSKDPTELMSHVYEDVLKPFSYMIKIQRAILEARADELFSQYLPEKSRRVRPAPSVSGTR